jgi:hypothetical protein
MSRSLRALLGLPAVALLAACAAKSNLVVVLPEADGHVGAVVVKDADGERVLDRAYAAEGGRAGSGSLSQVEVDDQEVKKIFGSALSARPSAIPTSSPTPRASTSRRCSRRWRDGRPRRWW